MAIIAKLYYVGSAKKSFLKLLFAIIRKGVARHNYNHQTTNDPEDSTLKKPKTRQYFIPKITQIYFSDCTLFLFVDCLRLIAKKTHSQLHTPLNQMLQQNLCQT